MKSRKENDDCLINLLMEETYQSIEVDNEAISAAELLNYYNKHESMEKVDENIMNFNQYIKKRDCSLYEFEYREKSRCFRLTSSDMIIDFPSNWSVFADAREALDSEILFLTEVSEVANPILYEVMNSQFFKGRKILLAHFYGEVHFLGFDSENEMQECLDVYRHECQINHDSLAA